MGQVQQEIEPVKFFFGILFSDQDLYEKAIQRIALDFGELEFHSEFFPFTQTTYYDEEMGKTISRQWIGLKEPLSPGLLAKVKTYTNKIEEWLCTLDESGDQGRKVNIDPGYLDLSKLILASTKDFSHRIYLSEGIFAELTLKWKKDEGFQAAGEWTYRDYLTKQALIYFNDLRNHFKAQKES